MQKLYPIELNNVISLLPATAEEIAKHFPNRSSRGIRNQLNKWVNEGELFTTKRASNKPGRPEIEYTKEKPIATVKTEGTFEGFVILEIMGHRKIGGYIKETAIAGCSFIRFDGFNEKGEVVVTQFYNTRVVYCITPVEKEVAIAFGLRS